MNSQNVADSLQKFNLKKAAIQKAPIALVGFVRMILHSGMYEYGDRLSHDHEITILEWVFPYHPAYANKIGSGVDHITGLQAVEKVYTDMINQRRRCKRMFKDYGLQSRTPAQKEFEKEELGLEYDEDQGVSLQSFDGLVLNVNK